MRLLFVKTGLAWPRASGQDVHGFYMMKALGELGHDVALATVARPSRAAVEGLRLELEQSLGALDAHGESGAPLTWLQDRFRSYYGIDQKSIDGLSRTADMFRADAVIAVGLEVLPYLAGIRGRVRVWYAADEWVWHHLSLCRFDQPQSWGNLKVAAVKGLYERAYAQVVDRAWVVSDSERRAMRWLAGVRAVDTIPNGVDGTHFAPRRSEEIPESAIFWGRLDFGPNIQALEWFCRRIWPAIRLEAPDARFTIVGFNPGAEVRSLALEGEGITLKADVTDLRAEAGRHAVVVLPFVSGGGIKNKLLEAASLGKPIVCSRRACNGLRRGPWPVIQANSVDDWTAAVVGLWGDAERRRRLGDDAREWVLTHHDWSSAARTAIAGLEQSVAGRAMR
jgi:glycosyltransferase involved in cell wall biosynthesis